MDTGADDNAMAQSTATELGLALVELSIPITVGLASSSDTNDLTITHCTVPVQLHIGKHVETITFYVHLGWTQWEQQ
jgi:predicted aspartyl protease